MSALQLLESLRNGPSAAEKAAIERWMRGKSENSRRTYNTAMQAFLAASQAETVEMACRTQELAKRSIAAFCASLVDKSPNTRHQRLSQVKRLLEFCESEDVCPTCAKYVPAEDHKPAPKMERWFPEDAEMAEMIATENCPEKRLLLQVLYGMGLRAHEAIGLRLENVRYFKSSETWAVWLTGKGRKSADVPIPESLVPEIMRLQLENEEGPWFRFQYGWAKRTVKAALRRIGIDEDGMCCHALRHAHCQNAQTAGVDEAKVSLNMRHSNVETTRQYGRFVQKSPGESLGIG